MNSVEEYQNLVELLKKTLEYYANEKLYEVVTRIGGKDVIHIMNDKGFQARFALDKIKELNASYEKMIEEYNNIMADIEPIDIDSVNPQDLINTLNALKNLDNDRNI